MLEQIRRYDNSRLRVTDSPTGGKVVEAYVTRTGVLTYRMSDGTVRRELRHPDEVFSAESMSSLAGAAVTDDHPAEMVNPDNWSALSMGHVDAPTVEDIYLKTRVHINARAGLLKLAAGAFQDCSCGYSADYEPTPGTYNGEAYDGIQRNIRYNHVALGGEGWGRAGPNVGLRRDGKSSILGVSDLTHPGCARIDSHATEGQEMKIKINGVEVEATQATLDAFAREHADKLTKESERADKAEALLKISEASRGTAEESATKEKTRADAAEKLIKDSAEVAKRSKVLAAIRRKEPTYLKDKKDEASTSYEALVTRCLKVFAPNFNPEGKSPEAIGGALEMALEMSGNSGEPEAAETADPAADSAVTEGELGAEDTEKPPVAADSIHATRMDRAPAHLGNAGGILRQDSLESIMAAQNEHLRSMAMIPARK